MDENKQQLIEEAIVFATQIIELAEASKLLPPPEVAAAYYQRALFYNNLYVCRKNLEAIKYIFATLGDIESAIKLAPEEELYQKNLMNTNNTIFRK